MCGQHLFGQILINNILTFLNLPQIKYSTKVFKPVLFCNNTIVLNRLVVHLR